MIRPAETRLPRRFLPLDDRKALRAFWRGAAIFGLIGFVDGRWLA